MIIIFYW